MGERELAGGQGGSSLLSVCTKYVCNYGSAGRYPCLSSGVYYTR